MTTEKEARVMQLEKHSASDCWLLRCGNGLQAARSRERHRKRHRKESPLEPLEGISLANTLVLAQ